MRIVQLALIVTFFSLNLQEEVRSRVPSIGSLLSEAMRASKAQGVSLIVQDSLRNEFAGQVLKEVLMMTADYPTLYTESGVHLSLSQNLSYTSTQDLFLYFFGSRQEPDAWEMDSISANLINLIQDIVRPKVLLLMVLEKESTNMRTIFETMWKSKILDTTILEVLHRNTMTQYVVMKYNPFTNTLSRENYSSSTEWYADQFPNMNGYPLKYSIFHRPPHTAVSRNRFGKIESIGGIDATVFKILAEAMNFTASHIDEKDVGLIERMANGSINVVFPNLLRGKVDLIASAFPMIFPEYYELVQYTVTVHIETWCFAVPKLQGNRQLFEGNPITIILISLAIVLVYWIISIVLRFNRRRWQPLYIAGIMLSASLPSIPTRFVERTIYLCLIATSVLYSSTLFAQLTRITTGKDFDLPFDDLTSLLNSGLVLMVHEPVVKVILEENEILREYFNRPGSAWKTTDTMILCVTDLIRFKNTSCFMDKSWAELAAVGNMRNGEKVLKRTQLCYMSPPAGYAFQKGSPYVEHVSHLLLLMNEAGIRYKLFQRYLRKQSSETSINEGAHGISEGSNPNIMYQIAYFLVCGYMASLVAFVGEILFKRFDVESSVYWKIFISSFKYRREQIGAVKRISKKLGNKVQNGFGDRRARNWAAFLKRK